VELVELQKLPAFEDAGDATLHSGAAKEAV
jgi:hypothetical protein